MSRNPLNANELYDEDFAAGQDEDEELFDEKQLAEESESDDPGPTLSSCRVSASVSWMLLSFILVR